MTVAFDFNRDYNSTSVMHTKIWICSFNDFQHLNGTFVHRILRNAK